MDERLQRAAGAVKSAGCDWAILTNFDSICYALGHAPFIETALSPFAGGPTTAFVRADGACGLVAPNVESAAAQASRADVKMIYEGFAYDHRADIVGNYTAAIAEMKSRLGIGGVLGAEPETLPATLAASLGAERTVDITEPLRRARATKTAEEKAQMRRSAMAAAKGQEAFYEWARPGRTELDVFAQVRAAMENFAGERTAVAGDFLSGKARTAGGVGWPISRVIGLNDPLISDLAPRVSGYWGDFVRVVGSGDASGRVSQAVQNRQARARSRARNHASGDCRRRSRRRASPLCRRRGLFLSASFRALDRRLGPRMAASHAL